MTGFFLPWNENNRQLKRGEKKLHLPKGTFSLEDAVFDNRKPAYVSLPNPRGTLRSFLQAVEGFLKDLKEYHCFADESRNGIRTVSVTKNSKDGEIFSFRMVAEPDSYGKWKIFSIEKEGKE